MQTHGNLTASYLWQPKEFARRLLGDRPSPVPPTRELWPPPQQLSISTLHIAYLQNEQLPRRSATLPAPLQASEQEHDYPGPRMCNVGTNTDPPVTIYTRLRDFVRRRQNEPTTESVTVVPRETTFYVKEEENNARRALNGLKKAITGAKHKIAPGTETVESPKIVYDISKPGSRMQTSFGVQERRTWYKLPSRADCTRRLRVIGGWCRRHPRRPPRRQSHLPRLQITQV